MFITFIWRNSSSLSLVQRKIQEQEYWTSAMIAFPERFPGELYAQGRSGQWDMYQLTSNIWYGIPMQKPNNFHWTFLSEEIILWRTQELWVQTERLWVPILPFLADWFLSVYVTFLLLSLFFCEMGIMGFLPVSPLPSPALISRV